MNPFNDLYEFLNRPNESSPDGRRYDVSFVERWRFARSEASEQFERLNLKPIRIMIFAAWTFMCLGILNPLRILFPLGAGFLIFLHLQNRKSWRASGNLEVDLLQTQSEVEEGGKVRFDIQLRNLKSQIIPFVLIEVPFTGSSQKFKVLVSESIYRKSPKKLSCEFPADLGWGEFECGPLTVTVSDELGFYLKTIKHSQIVKVKVRLKSGDGVTKIAINNATIGSHSGNIELPISGRSISFYGLRDYHQGDEVKLIDWKKSTLGEQLVIKEFERFSATDATVLFDDSFHGHSSFMEMSSFNTSKEAALAVIDQLRQQNVRMRFVSNQFSSDYGNSFGFKSEIAKRLLELTPLPKKDFRLLLSKAVLDVTPHSLFFLFFTTNSVTLDELTAPLLHLLDRGVDPVLILIDSMAFAYKATSAANLGKGDNFLILRNYFSRYDESNKSMADFSRRISERTYLITPDQPLSTLYDEVKGL